MIALKIDNQVWTCLPQLNMVDYAAESRLAEFTGHIHQVPLILQSH